MSRKLIRNNKTLKSISNTGLLSLRVITGGTDTRHTTHINTGISQTAAAARAPRSSASAERGD